jgi:hypothetical protein
MTATNLEDALHQKPFKPLELHLDNGKTVHVKHPDCVLLTLNKQTAVVDDGDRLHIMGLDHISSLSFASGLPKSQS